MNPIFLSARELSEKYFRGMISYQAVYTGMGKDEKCINLKLHNCSWYGRSYPFFG